MIELAAALLAQKAELWRVLRMWLVLGMRCLLPSELLSLSQQDAVLEHKHLVWCEALQAPAVGTTCMGLSPV